MNSNKITNYHFYNKEFEPIINVNATSYEGVDTDKECMFVIKILENNTEKKKLINTELGIIREINYDVIKFPVNHQDGYGIDFTTGKIDFFDEKLEMLIPNFNYKKYDLNIYNFGYFIVNDYICVINHFTDSYGKSRDEVIIQNKNGDTILDSINHRCYALGIFIQIMHNKESEFLNTLTGEIGPLSISAKVDETGKIDLKRINNMSTLLTTDNNTRLSIPTADDNISPKIKKLKNEQQKPDYK